MATSIALPALVLRDTILRIVAQDEGSESGTSGSHDGGTGQFVIGPRAVSHALARRSTPMSSKRLPMICTPIGRPPVVNAALIEIAGCSVMFHGTVNAMCSNGCSGSSFGDARSAAKAGIGAVGEIR